MAMALKIVDAHIGPVFLLREGMEVSEGDVAYAATLFPDVPCYFVIDQARDHLSGIQTSIAQQRRTTSNCLFKLGERLNTWLSSKLRLKGEEFDVLPLSDGEINRLSIQAETVDRSRLPAQLSLHLLVSLRVSAY
jgi:hypothetical protein